MSACRTDTIGVIISQITLQGVETHELADVLFEEKHFFHIICKSHVEFQSHFQLSFQVEHILSNYFIAILSSLLS